MNKSGPVLVIEDDIDDQEIFNKVFRNLNYQNEILYFDDGNSALNFLKETTQKPFLILSDINMPKMDGMKLRETIQEDKALSLKCIPFLFFTTSASHSAVIEAYSNSAQGFFVKPSTMSELQRVIRNIIEYWKDSKDPNSF